MRDSSTMPVFPRLVLNDGFLLMRLDTRRLLLTLVVALASLAEAQTRTPEQQADYRKSMERADRQIFDEVKAHSELMKNLEYLTTQIGPRLTGSPQMIAAGDWTRKRFQQYGLEAHLETANIEHGWARGAETAEIVSPIQRRIGIHAYGWSKATGGDITARVATLDIESPAELDKYKDTIKDAIVLLRAPVEVMDLDPNPDNAYDAVIRPLRDAGGAGIWYCERIQLQEKIREFGAALVLTDSGKTDSLFNMAGTLPRYQPSQVPAAFLTHEDYDLIWRLARSGEVRLRVNLQNRFSEKPAPASITVAEIRGWEKPEERVIIGGHLDSWDLGQGALDNGTGAMAVLEAARTLHALGWKPKRTITFVLFTGEEQGGIGVDTYLKNHAADIPRMDGVLIHDTGTGRVFSIALNHQWETALLFSEIYRPLQEVFELQALSTRYFSGSDHVAFMNAGVPGYFCIQLPAHYREVHHSQTDTFDKVIPAEINQGAALLAAWAWNVSEMPEALPHHAAGEEKE
jgi:hypothetical protein